jgi:hypothetical protein
MLPADLHAVEDQALGALRSALAADARGRWSVEWRFEGLRLLPPALRMARALLAGGVDLRLLFPDAGAAALARRDGSDLGGLILDFGALQRSEAAAAGLGGERTLLLAVAPTPADYEDFVQICTGYGGAVVMLNGRLEDAAVGIGSVARQRRRGFLAQWQTAYAVMPVEGGALRRAHPQAWEVHREDPDGFRLVATFAQKPDPEELATALAGGDGIGLGGNLRVLDAFIEGLRH